MNVLVKYFNKRNGTIEAMNDYGPMQTILNNTDRLIKEAYENLEGVGSPKVTGLPRAHNPKAGEAGWFQVWMILLFSVTGTHRPKPTWNGSSRPGTH